MCYFLNRNITTTVLSVQDLEYHIALAALGLPTVALEGVVAVDPATCHVFLYVTHPMATFTTQPCMVAGAVVLAAASVEEYYVWMCCTYLSWMDTFVQTVLIWLVIGLVAAVEVEVASTFVLETSQVGQSDAYVVDVNGIYKLTMKK